MQIILQSNIEDKIIFFKSHATIKTRSKGPY